MKNWVAEDIGSDVNDFNQYTCGVHDLPPPPVEIWLRWQPILYGDQSPCPQAHESACILLAKCNQDQIFDHVFGNVMDDAKVSGPWEFWQGREGGADVITGDLWSKLKEQMASLAPSGYACPVSNDLCIFW